MKVHVDLFPIYLQMLKRHSGDLESMDETHKTQTDNTGEPFVLFCLFSNNLQQI